MARQILTTLDPPAPRVDPVLSRSEVCDALGISLWTLDLMHQRGEGPPRFKISPRRWGYPTSKFLEWQRQRLAEAQQTP